MSNCFFKFSRSILRIWTQNLISINYLFFEEETRYELTYKFTSHLHGKLVNKLRMVIRKFLITSNRTPLEF